MSFFDKLAHQISANAENPPRQLFSASITRAGDVDEFLETIRGYRVRLMQIEKGPLVAEAIQTRFAGVLFTATQYQRAVVHSGEPPPGKITFVVGLSEVPILFQGIRFGPHDLLMLTPGDEIDVVSQAGCGLAAVSFPFNLVREAASLLGLTPLAPLSSRVVIGLEPEKASLLRAAFSSFLNEAVATPLNERASTSWALTKQKGLLRFLLNCIVDTSSKTKSASNGERARVLKAALEAINDSTEDDVITVGDLCRIARASERTLDYAFAERFGLSPAQYMKARRLNAARDDFCRDHEHEMKIADIANKWGFWHLGQFARDYQTWFGELPSETYERRHRTTFANLR
jgi:AraC family transcriptional regulator, ethanolamine operon transcriptional activator